MANQISTVQVMASGHLHGQGWQPSHWAPLWPLVAIKVTVIHTGPGCSRIKDPNMPFGSTLPGHHHGCLWQAGHQHPPTPQRLLLFPSATLHSTRTIPLLCLSPFSTTSGGPMDVFLLARALGPQLACGCLVPA